MATHSSILAWRTPRTKQPGGFVGYSPWGHKSQTQLRDSTTVYWAARPGFTTYRLKSYKAHFVLAPSACGGGNNSSTRDFPIGPVVKTPGSQCRVQSLVRELKSFTHVVCRKEK